MPKPLFRRQAQRDALIAVGHEARELVKTLTINECLALYPKLSRATLYRAMRLSAEHAQSAVDPLLL